MTRLLLTILIWILGIHCSNADFRIPSPYGWKCTPDKFCEKILIDGVEPHMSMAECKLTCGDYASLWPRPKTITVSKDVVEFSLDYMTTKYNAPTIVQPLIEEALILMKNNIEKYRNHLIGDAESISKTYMNVIVDVTIAESNTDIELNIDESYDLEIKKDNVDTTVIIIAKNFFGARHALETLSQLIEYDVSTDSFLMVSTAQISDNPEYTHRGIILDTARNFMSIEDLERTLDAMAANKLNAFHWHISDSNSFPIMLKTLPQMAYYGAHSSTQVYYIEEIKNLIAYARVRGIRIIPEIDIPAHVGFGWNWGPQFGIGDLAVCVNKDPWTSYCVQPPCGQLNIANQKIYEVLAKIYKELVDIFEPMEIFHYGGDEVHLNCWNTTNEIVEWMEAKGNDLTADDYYREWSNFQTKAQEKFDDANGKGALGILWTSHLTEKDKADQYLDPQKNIIQIWSTGTDPLITELLQKNFKLIISNHDAWYLDCGMGAWVGDGNNWCSPYIGWQLVYNNSLTDMAGVYKDQILGGEAALWTEQTDFTSLDAKLWPRGSAVAERLWTDPVESWEKAEPRFIHHRQRLVSRGIRADRVQPQWCHQNEGKCVL